MENLDMKHLNCKSELHWSSFSLYREPKHSLFILCSEMFHLCFASLHTVSTLFQSSVSDQSPFYLLFFHLSSPPFSPHFLLTLISSLYFLPSCCFAYPLSPPLIFLIPLYSYIYVLPCLLIPSVNHVIFLLLPSLSPLLCSHILFFPSVLSPFISSPYPLSVLFFLLHLLVFLLSNSLKGQWFHSCLPWENVCDTPERWQALVWCHQVTGGLGGGVGVGGWCVGSEEYGVSK